MGDEVQGDLPSPDFGEDDAYDVASGELPVVFVAAVVDLIAVMVACRRISASTDLSVFRNLVASVVEVCDWVRSPRLLGRRRHPRCLAWP